MPRPSGLSFHDILPNLTPSKHHYVLRMPWTTDLSPKTPLSWFKCTSPHVHVSSKGPATWSVQQTPDSPSGMKAMRPISQERCQMTTFSGLPSGTARAESHPVFQWKVRFRRLINTEIKKWLNAFLPTKDDSEETSELQTPTQQGTSWDLSWDCITDSFLLLPSPVSIHFFHTCWC